MFNNVSLAYHNFLPSVGTIKDVIQSKTYTFKKSLEKCCSSDYKTYALVVLGCILHAAAIATGLFSIVGLFTIGPISVLGSIPTIIMGLFGHYILAKNLHRESIPISLPFTNSSKPFVPGQPIGLVNSNTNCWISASMQCIIHNKALHERACKIPELAEFIKKYAQLQSIGQPMPASYVDALNVFLMRAMEMRRRNEVGTNEQADATSFFEWILHQYHLYEFTRFRITSKGELIMTIARDEELLRLNLKPHISQSLNEFFSHFTHEGDEMRLMFNTCPETLIVNFKRYYMHFINPSDPSSLHFVHNTNPIEGIDGVIKLTGETTVSRQQGNYACDAFIVHSGSFSGGHYVAYIKQKGKWWCCNDMQISEVPDAVAIQQMKNCYLFFANKINT